VTAHIGNLFLSSNRDYTCKTVHTITHLYKKRPTYITLKWQRPNDRSRSRRCILLCTVRL